MLVHWERLTELKFDLNELFEITTEKEFSYARAQQWMLNHEAFSMQIVFQYLMTIFMLKQLMKDRPPFQLIGPIKVWNLTIALLSGVCTAGMTGEFLTTFFTKGVNPSLCSTGDTFFHGRNGWFLWCYHIIRLFEFTDTLFIILRKQPLLFIHWYHHALTLFVSWFCYARPSPYTRYAIYINAIIHTVMYTYYFLRASKVRMHTIIAKVITAAQIAQFGIAFWSIIHATVLKFILAESCELDTGVLCLSWFMDICYLYLFVDFYRSKYIEKSKSLE